MARQNAGILSNKLIFWLAIAMIAYAVYDATKERSTAHKNKKEPPHQTSSQTTNTSPHVQSSNTESTIHSSPSTDSSTSATGSAVAGSNQLPLPPIPANGTFLEKMVAKYVAPSIQKSVEGQIDSRLTQLQNERLRRGKLPNAPHMSLKSFDKTIGKGIAVSAGKTVTFDITLWYLDGLEVMPNRTATIKQGAGQIYAGVEQGLESMKPGGIRTLIIPTYLLTSKTDNVLGSVAFYPDQGLLAEIHVKEVK